MPDQISVVDILILPGLLGFIGIAWYLLYWNRGRIFEKPDRRRWFGMPFLVIAAIVGAKYSWAMLDPTNGPFYRAQFVGPGTKRIVVAHYLAFLGPVLAIVGAFIFDRLTRPRL